MIYGNLSAPDAYNLLLATPAWKSAFDWVKTLTPATPKGRVSLQGNDIYANIHGYETLPAEECPFESHRRYVDLQYCIAGSEVIQWSLATNLRPNGAYSSDDDILFYARPLASVTHLQMVPGTFAIFFPSDAHAPKVRDGTGPSVFKVVIKLDAQLLGVPASW